MRIAALALPSRHGPVEARLDADLSGLNVIERTDADPARPESFAPGVLANLLYNHRPPRDAALVLDAIDASHVDVEHAARRYRLRRVSIEGQVAVAPLDGAPIERAAVERLFADISPTAARLCAIDFRQPPPIEWLLSSDVATALLAVGRADDRARPACAADAEDPALADARRRDALIERRDEIAKELEARIAEDRRARQKVEARWRELDARYQTQRRATTAIREKLQATRSELAELDARLRYARDDAESGLPSRAEAWKAQLAELDEQIARHEALLAEVDHQRAEVNRQLTGLDSPEEYADLWALTVKRAWLTTSRRVATDLDGEVARLARSNDAHSCVCLDAHPRLRPIADAMQAQLAAFEAILDRQERWMLARELREELEHLDRSRDALRAPLECLLDRRRTLARHCDIARRMESGGARSRYSGMRVTALGADAEGIDFDHLVGRRAECAGREQALRDELALAEPALQAIRDARDALSRRRTELLAIRPIEESQQELSAVQRALQQLATGASETETGMGVAYASEYLAQLTGGRLVELRVDAESRRLRVVNHAGEIVDIASLVGPQSDQIRLAICLALVAASREHGMELPLILDEPFARLARRDIAALAAVLEDFGLGGRQTFVFTSHPDAIARFGAAVRVFTQDGPSDHREPALVAATASTDRGGRGHGARGHDARNDTARHSDTFDDESLEDDRFAYDENSAVSGALHLRDDTAAALERLGVITIAHLWDADPNEIAAGLARRDISGDTVRSWQRLAALICFVPGVTLDDARVLKGAGVDRLDAFADADPTEVYDAIERYLRAAGRRYPNRGERYRRERVARWIRGARRHRSRWRGSERWRRARRRLEGRAATHPITPRPNRQTERTVERAEGRAYRFHLSLGDPVVDAPSIGDKTAARLKRLGVRTVGDLLNANPEEIANRLDSRRIAADTVRAWRRQARLCCEIPEIRGHDARILVSCDLTDPEEIARMRPEELLRRIAPFCESKAGERIIRSCKKPDLDEVTDWIAWAAHRRTLDAA